MHFAVTGRAIVVGGILNQDKFRFQLAALVEGGGVPLVAVSRFLEQPGTDERGGVRQVEFPGADFNRAGFAVRLFEMAQEAVHFHCARLTPVPGCGLVCFWIQDGGFGVGGIAAETCQRGTLAGGRRRAAAGNPLAELHQPFGGAQIQAVIAFLGEITVVERVPFAEHAAAGVHLAADGLIGAQAKVGVEAVRFNEGGIMTLAAGFHRRDGLAALEHVFTLGIEHGKDRVHGRRLRSGSGGRFGKNLLNSKGQRRNGYKAQNAN